MTAPLILRIAVPAPLYGLFDYLPPPGCDPARLTPGIRLKVPFGRGERIGLLIAVTDTAEVPLENLKPALEPLDPEPLFDTEDLALLRWGAEYYQHPLGEVLENALPVRLRQGLEQRREAAGQAPEGWRLTAEGMVIDPATMKRAKKQAAVLAALNESPLSRTELTEQFGDCAETLRTLRKQGWIEPASGPCGSGLQPRPTAPDSGIDVAAASRSHNLDLNPTQQSAVSEVIQAWGRFQPFLLDGVTGSGKTEVYLTLMEHALSRNEQALLLVPEIGLTPQLLRRVRRRIAAPIALLHSGLSPTEREAAWHAARRGEARIVIGTRSAVFTPLPELGLILVDEEHDLSYKQQDGFRYHARDIAVVRASRRGCPVVLGSATPSFESLHNVSRGRYQELRLPERAGSALNPRMDLIDLRTVRLEGGIAPALRKLIDETLARDEQVLLFLNRRGYAPLLVCHTCGWIAQCRHCDARMTMHRDDRLLCCHHCGGQRRLDTQCPECGSPDLRPLGQGTERLEETLQRLYPEQSLVRIDRDSTRRKGSLEARLEEIREGRHRILFGTQMLAKGHHFPQVTLVGILDADQGLYGVDYRAAERMAQQIVQVAGRAGRAERPGRVAIQTHHPDHPLLQRLIREGYPPFARENLEERRSALLPPYTHQVLLRAESTQEAPPKEFLREVAEHLRPQAGEIEILGPVPAPMERRAGHYRAHLLLQSPRRSSLQNLMSKTVPQLHKLPGSRKVRWSVDVDPMEML